MITDDMLAVLNADAREARARTEHEDAVTYRVWGFVLSPHHGGYEPCELVDAVEACDAIVRALPDFLRDDRDVRQVSFAVQKYRPGVGDPNVVRRCSWSPQNGWAGLSTL